MSTNISQESTIGPRLREERERLHLTQGLMAAQIGINRMSQANYESGKRSPDAAYLHRAATLGVDVSYVVTGQRENAPDFFRIAADLVFQAIEVRTGLADDVLRFVAELISEQAAQAWIEAAQRPGDKQDPSIDLSEWVDIARTRALVDAAVENDRLLRDVFANINSVLFERAIRLAPDKRLTLVLMFFRSSLANGHVDQALIAEAVALAAK